MWLPDHPQRSLGKGVGRGHMMWLTHFTDDFGTTAGVPDSAAMGGECNLVVVQWQQLAREGDVTGGQGNFHRERPIRRKRWLRARGEA